MKTIQLLEDDLKFASEHIQQIAIESIRSIERLYKLRFEEPKVTPLSVDNPRVQPMTIDNSRVTPLSVDNSRVQPLSVDNSNVTPMTVDNSRVQPLQPLTVERKPLVDQNLHNLAL